MKILIFAVLLGTTHSAFAIELKFGPEFAVSNNEMLQAQHPMPIDVPSLSDYRLAYCENPVIENMHGKLYEYWQAKYLANALKDEEFKIEPLKAEAEERFQFISPEGFSVWLGVDPAVIEMGTAPMTVKEFKKHEKPLQQMIFDDSKALGLSPQAFTGGGHINIGLHEFKDNRILLMNFILDFYNHPELSMGVFGYDTNNAFHLRQSSENLYKLRLEFEKELRNNPHRKYTYFLQTFGALVSPLMSDPYYRFWRQKINIKDNVRASSYAIQVKMDSENVFGFRLEIRAVRPQTSMNQWVRMIRLLQARINYLEQFDELIPLQLDKVKVDRAGPIAEKIKQPPVDPQQALQHFYNYVTESGEPWLDHQDYLWPQWHIDGEIIKFNNQMMESCEDFLRSS